MKKLQLKIIALLLNFHGLMADEKSGLEEGETYFNNKDYAKAAIYLDQAVTSNEEAPWIPEALLKLSKCYLELAMDPKQSEKNRNDNFEKAESILLRLKDIDDSDKINSALARAYIIQGTQLKNREALEKGKSLVQSNPKGEYSRLLTAEASQNYEERKVLYSQIVHSSSPWIGFGWYFTGLNELESGYYPQAAAAFEEAYPFLYPKNMPLAALCLKYQAEAYASQQTKEGNLKALSTLNQFNDSELTTHLANPGEIFYLRGLVAARLFEEGAGAPFGEIAEKSFTTGLKSYPKGQHIPEMMKSLGILYLRQQKMVEATDILQKLVNTYSTSTEAEEALLYLGKDSLKKLYTDYPSSTYADEAFFRDAYEEYLKGNEEAIEQLKLVEEKYPNSRYLVLTHYLLGLHFKKKNELETAADYFERSEKFCIDANETAIQAALERALILLELERMDESEIVLKRIIDRDADELSPVIQKSAYHLINIYVKEHQDNEAEQLIKMMLKKYENSKINQGYYLSRLWYERGMIAMRETSPQQALRYLMLSESTAKKDDLEVGQLLDLWIQQSLCYLELGEMDKSMLILSRVTNYNATSSLRVKAMYLRAEIYERQGRYELAKKQLRATSTKGGEWALKAKQKLEKDYVQHPG